MKNGFLFFLLLISFLLSCRTTMPCKDCFKVKERHTFQLDNIPFSDSESTLYKVNIDIYSMHFSGILASKKFGEDHFRMTLMSETGFKLFDIEIRDGEAEMSSVFHELDRPGIRDTFKEDFTLMVLSGMRGRKCDLYRFNTSEYKLYVCPEKGNKSTIAVLNMEKKVIERISNTRQNGGAYFEIKYEYEKGFTPVAVSIIHSNVKLKIELTLLEAK